MKRNIYYRYNPATDTYERVFPTRRQRMWQLTKHLLEGFVIGAAILLAVYSWVELPREKRLIAENQRLSHQLIELSNRVDRAVNVMDILAERDNNFYRVIMQLDPITASQRYAGLDAIPQIDNGNDDDLNDDELVRSVTAKIKLFERQVYVQSQSFDQLANTVKDNADRIAHIPSIQPINSRDLRQMASGYGYRVDPVYGTTKFHDGMDFASPIGTPVYATGDGTVTSASYSGGYGNLIEINHGYNYTTRFAHLSKMFVKPGQKVSRGDLIGEVGSTGKSTGSHLHYEVLLSGVPQNPVHYYFADLTPEEYAEMVQEADIAAHVMD